MPRIFDNIETLLLLALKDALTLLSALISALATPICMTSANAILWQD
jgi:hypothetical protein